MANDKTKTAIFNINKTEDAVTVVRDTLSLVQDDTGQVFVAFTTNKGKGSGLQHVKADEFPALLAEFRKVADEGIPEREGSASAIDVFRRTIYNEDGTLSFRTSDGKGAKPAKVDAAEFAKVVKVLEDALPAIQAAIEDLD